MQGLFASSMASLLPAVSNAASSLLTAKTADIGAAAVPLVSGAADALSSVAGAATMMGDPTQLAIAGAKWALSSSFAGSVGAIGVGWAGKLLMGHYGADIVQGFYGTIFNELGKLSSPEWWRGAPPVAPKTKPLSLFSLENAQTLMGVASQHSRALFAVLLVVSLQYLHALGAYEMRRQVRARGPPPPKKQMPNNNNNENIIMDPVSLRALYAARVAATAPTGAVMAAEEVEDAGLLEQLLHSLYASHPFYAPALNAKQEAAYFTLSDNHPVRMVVNLLLGFLMQLNALLAPGGGSTTLDDPIGQVARATSVLAYFELLMRALRLYGWAPLYVGTRLVASVFLAPPALNK